MTDEVPAINPARAAAIKARGEYNEMREALANAPEPADPEPVEQE